MTATTFSELRAGLGKPARPIVLDVRREAAYRQAADTIAGALRRNPETIGAWKNTLPKAGSVVVYCVHGHEVSQNVAKALNDAGIQARFLEGGLEGWKENAGPLDAKPAGGSTRWVTRERPKIDRIACPWLIARFIDPDAEFLYVPAKEVLGVAQEKE